MLCEDTAWLISTYWAKPVFKLRDWIDMDKIDWKWLSMNPAAIHLLEQNPDKINWE